MEVLKRYNCPEKEKGCAFFTGSIYLLKEHVRDVHPGFPGIFPMIKRADLGPEDNVLDYAMIRKDAD